MNEWELFLEHKMEIPSELLEVFKTIPAQNFKKDEMIYWQGEIAENLYYLKKGKVTIFINSEDGLEKILTVNENGSFFGEASLLDGLPRISSAKALSDSEIVVISKVDLILCFKERPSLALNFTELLSQKIRMLSNQIGDISFLSADKRIAQYLLNMTLDGNYSISCTQEHIGKSIGVNRETVSYILNKFCKNKWIDTKYKRIVILNKAALFQFLKD